MLALRPGGRITASERLGPTRHRRRRPKHQPERLEAHGEPVPEPRRLAAELGPVERRPVSGAVAARSHQLVGLAAFDCKPDSSLSTRYSPMNPGKPEPLVPPPAPVPPPPPPTVPPPPVPPPPIVSGGI